MIALIFLCLELLLLPALLFAATCSTFANPCRFELGQAILAGNRPVKLYNQSQYYMTFDVRLVHAFYHILLAYLMCTLIGSSHSYYG
jgi:hypothetical protein